MTNIHPTAIIHNNVTLGKNVTIEAYAVLGSPAEHRLFWNKPKGKVVIGDNCIIREYVTINAGTEGITYVGDNCILLRGSHVGHDAKLGDFVTLSCNAIVGGHSYVMSHANIGLGATIRQKLCIGFGAMVGMNAAVIKHVHPWTVVAGVPAKTLKRNDVGMQRAGITEDRYNEDVKTWEKLLCEYK